ncbi:hypothetical protein ACOBV9_22390 (plasmid) [Pseudoalteromonas espejiana]
MPQEIKQTAGCAQLTELKNKIAAKEHEIQAQGGAWAKTKDQEQAKASELIELEKELTAKIRQELSGSLPMALAPTAMQSLIEQLTSDQQIKQAKAFGNELVQALPNLESALNQKFDAQSSDIMATVNSYFGQLVNQTALAEPKLDISDSEFALINAQVQEASQSQALIKSYQQRFPKRKQVSSLSINIERAPDADLHELYTSLRLEKQRDTTSKEYIKRTPLKLRVQSKRVRAS